MLKKVSESLNSSELFCIFLGMHKGSRTMLCVLVLLYLNVHLVCQCIYDSLLPNIQHVGLCAFCVCVCACTGVEILRHVTAGGLMPMG